MTLYYVFVHGRPMYTFFKSRTAFHYAQLEGGSVQIVTF